MTKKIIKKIWVIIMFSIFNIIVLPHNTIAEDINVEWFNIIPELTETQLDEANTRINRIWETWWKVMERYREEAEKLKDKPSQQIAQWIMDWDTIMNYLVFVVKFLSQLWLAVWVIFIMYAWYKYMLSIFNWWKTPSSTLLNAIIWVVIIIFSYAIMKILTSIIWLS